MSKSFLGNKSTRIVHNLLNPNDNCQTKEIEEKEYFDSLNQAYNKGYKPCSYCIEGA
jgi:methylphosphotriester-DNA--protein-cysteine methyltransferase